MTDNNNLPLPPEVEELCKQFDSQSTQAGMQLMLANGVSIATGGVVLLDIAPRLFRLLKEAQHFGGLSKDEAAAAGVYGVSALLVSVVDATYEEPERRAKLEAVLSVFGDLLGAFVGSNDKPTHDEVLKRLAG